MEVDHDAKTKFFLVMPFVVGMTDSEGEMRAFFPSASRCEILLHRDDAEKSLLEKQKQDPDTTYIILESIAICAKHTGKPEYCVIDTVQW